MQDLYIVKTREEIKALAEPMRIRLLEAFGGEPMTTKQAAQQMGVSATKLYHHVELLEKLGLIELVKTNRVRGATEKYYQAVARHYRFDEAAMFGQSAEELETLQGVLDGILAATRAQLRDSIRAGLLDKENMDREGTVSQTVVRASPKEIKKLERMLNKWLEAVRATNRKDGEAVYGATVFFFPLVQEERRRR